MIPDWLILPSRPLDEVARLAARQRQAQLTKPPGSLGQLEELACSWPPPKGGNVRT